MQGFSRLAFSLSLCVALGSGAASVFAQDAAAPPAADATSATAPSPEQVLAGKRVWVDAACFNCHGTNAQGGNSKDFPHGPSLRTSETDRATMLEVIACGLPGTRMPAWAKGAYTERPCFGETGPVPEGTVVIGAYDEAQLAALMDYIYATYRKNKP
jgi:mono/diheme cytochrome c family protein